MKGPLQRSWDVVAGLNWDALGAIILGLIIAAWSPSIGRELHKSLGRAETQLSTGYERMFFITGLIAALLGIALLLR